MDGSGHATGLLMKAVGYQGSSVAFIQLVAAMDRDGEISRDIRGKRTYRISSVGDSADPDPGATNSGGAEPGATQPGVTRPGEAAGSRPIPSGVDPPPRSGPPQHGLKDAEMPRLEIDYRRLAQALVHELMGYLAGSGLPAQEDPGPRPVQGLSAPGAVEAVAQAQNQVESLRQERARLIAERDEYARRLETARSKLEELLGSRTGAREVASRSAIMSGWPP